MILATYIVLILIIVLLFHKHDTKILSFPVIFSMVWFSFAGLSSIGVMGMRTPSLIVHLCCVTYVLIIDFCFIIRANDISFTFRKTTVGKWFFCQSRFKYLQIIALLLAYSMIYRAIMQFSIGGDLASIRLSYYGDSLSNNPVIGLCLKEMPMGILRALVIVYSLYAFESGRVKYLVFAFMNELIITFINGGRVDLFNLFLILILIYAYKGHGSIRMNNKLIKRTKILAIAIVCAIVGVSILRGQSFIGNIISYFSGSFSFFDYIIENKSYFDLNNHSYGYMTFGAILEPFVLILKYLGLTSAKVPSYFFNYYCQSYYNIGVDGYNVYINNNTTCFYFFYKDFGYAGIVFGALLMGIIISMLYRKWINEDNKLAGLLFIYFSIVIVDGILSYRLIGTGPLFQMASLLICVKKVFPELINRKGLS